jgi:hypothetical protein
MRNNERMEAGLMVSPLTILVRGVVEWTFPVGFTALFEEYAQGRWTRKLTINAIVWLMLQVVAGVRKSVFAAFQADQSEASPTVAATYQALYGKLGRLNVEFSEALVQTSAERLQPLLEAAGCRWYSGWKNYRVRILDGTDAAGTEHRLRVLRKIKAAGLPARFVVEYDAATGLCTQVVASEDAYASERRLVRKILAQATANDLFVADRFYCTTDFMAAVVLKQAFAVVREHAGHLRILSEGKCKKRGKIDTGTVYEQTIEVEDTETGETWRWRRIIIQLTEPTREGEMEIRLITNLPTKVHARRVAALYRKRWTLERHFDFLKNCLHAEIESLGRPSAAVFAMCMSLVTANALAAIKQALRFTHGEEEFEKLSGYYLADEVAGNYRAIDTLIHQATWRHLSVLPPRRFWRWMGNVASHVRTRAFHKHPRGPKNPHKPKRASGKNRHHYSTYRLLNEKKKIC